MISIKASEDLRPMSDLKSYGADIVRHVTQTRRPVVLTKHGRGVAVVLSLEEYENLFEMLRRLELRKAVDEAEQDITKGRTLSNKEILKKLSSWTHEKETRG